MVAETLAEQTPKRRQGSKPRIAPPIPLRADIAEYKRESELLGFKPMPAQLTLARFVNARRPDGKRLYREIAMLIARQNGKTTGVKPVITAALRAGLRVMHLANTRELPREMFDAVATALSDEPSLFPRRRGKIIWPRYGAGQEEVKLENGGRYRIAAARTGGARGWTNDVLIIDETRELLSFDVIDAAVPTTAGSPDPLVLYLSNAGTDKSVVLQSLRTRAENGDPNLAYIEWSASPERDAGDPRAWAEANPGFGYIPGLRDAVEAAYVRARTSGNMAGFETEHLCRWVPTLMPPIVPAVLWQRALGRLDDPTRPVLAFKVDPEGRRASAVIAWMADSICNVRSFAEDVTTPLDVDAFAQSLQPLIAKYRVSVIGYDPWTDRDLARHFKNAKAINGADYEAAGRRFVAMLEGNQLRHDDDGTIGDDLAYTVKRDTPNGWYAVRADAERPTTAGEAAIRAVWLATQPGLVSGIARIH